MAFKFIDSSPGSTARRFLISGAWWFVGGGVVGLTAATELVAPDLIGARVLIFPRIRPVHVNTMVFGFLSMMLIGGILYAVCRLSRAQLYSETMGNVAMWIWNFAVLAGFLTIPAGFTTSHEYGEYVFPISVALMVAVIMLAINMFKTLARRTEQLLYVTNWYAIGAFTATMLVFFFGKVLWHPKTSALTGMNDAEWAWFYGHNIFGTWITPLALGLSYFWIPREADNPLYSHAISLLGFWPYFAFYLQVGTHHLIEAPAQPWLKLIAEVNSVGLLIPVYAFLTNQWMTLRGRWWKVPDSIVLKFIFAGTVMYFFTSTEGTIEALPSFQRIAHFTNVTVGHAHLGLLGFSGFIACGAGYGVLREMYGEIWSERLAQLQYWLMLIGILGFTFVLTSVGLLQGLAWRNGETVYRVLPEIFSYYVERGVLGCFILTGAAIQVYNFLKTVYMHRQRQEAEFFGLEGAAARPAALSEAAGD
ncbi:MAG: cbb3-type cytochrome c oxidase subunit I [Terriglobales bacterium]